MTAGLIPADTAAVISMTSLEAVAKDTGVHLTEQGDGGKVVYGSPKNILDASKKLSTVNNYLFCTNSMVLHLLSPAAPKAREILQRPPSVCLCLSVCPSRLGFAL